MNASPERAARPPADTGTLLLGLALALALLALLRPTLSLPTTLQRQVLVFDISQSMNVMDADGGRRTRIEHAKHSAREAVARLPCGSQIGVAVFTGHRSLVLFTPVESCAHFHEITAVIDSLDWRMAWEFRSEIAKGVHSALAVMAALERPATLVFFSDGHEAPPLNPLLRPRFRGSPGEVRGVLVGVGGDTPVPIPKFGPDGRQDGFFSAGEVMQIDAFSQGRATGGDEAMVGEGGDTLAARAPSGTEHLSSLREDYLRQLADELELDYLRLTGSAALAEVMTSAAYGREQPRRRDIRWLVALASLAVLVAALLLGARGAQAGRGPSGAARFTTARRSRRPAAPGTRAAPR